MNAHCATTGIKAQRGQQALYTDDRSASQNCCCRFSSGVDFNPDRRAGSIILNIIYVDSISSAEAVYIVKKVLASPYAFSTRFAVVRGGNSIGDFKVPAQTTAICTVCSITLNALLQNHGIDATSKFGGVVEVSHHQPKKFSAFLSSGFAPLAPLDIFISCAMTSICKTIQSGTGDVLGSFLEIPESHLPDAKKLYNRIKKIGMGGKIIFGMPNQSLMGMPVSIGSAGIVVFQDLNTAAALTEKGLKCEVCTEKLLHDYAMLE